MRDKNVYFGRNQCLLNKKSPTFTSKTFINKILTF